MGIKYDFSSDLESRETDGPGRKCDLFLVGCEAIDSLTVYLVEKKGVLDPETFRDAISQLEGTQARVGVSAPWKVERVIVHFGRYKQDTNYVRKQMKPENLTVVDAASVEAGRGPRDFRVALVDTLKSIEC